MFRPRRSFAIAPLLLFASLFASDPAHAVDRATAAATVVGSVIAFHPDNDQLIAFGPQATIPAGTVVKDGYEGRDALTTPSTCWLFWINPHPEERFAHTSQLVLVDEISGSIVLQTDIRFWPRIGGVNYYANSDERDFLNPDIIYAGPQAFTAAREVTREAGVEALKLLPPDPSAGKWALVISGSGTAANGDEKADVDTAKAIFRDVLGVPDGNITVADNQDKAALCATIAAMPKNCPKLYVYVTAHGMPGFFGSGGDTILATEFAHKLKDLMAGEYCIVMAQCFSGSFLDVFRDSTLSGMHVTSAAPDTTAWARTFTSAKFPWKGEVFTHYWANCHRQGKLGIDAYSCARDSVAAYVARRAKVGTAPHNPMPGASVVFKDTTSGQATTFRVPSGTGSVCIQWKPGPANACGNASVYCQVVNGPDTTWKVVKVWNWNLGETRYFSPNGPGATGTYKLVSHANGYPDCGDIRFLATAVPETPTSVPTFAAASLGWRDQAAIELWPLTLAGSNSYNPGLELGNVPRNVGALGTGEVPLFLNVPLQPDFSRPWLYFNGNPFDGINAQVTVETPVTGIFDPFGNPVPFMQLQLDFQQGPTFRQFQVFAQDLGSGLVWNTVDLGLVMPEPFTLVLHSPPGAPALMIGNGPGGGYFELDAFIVNMITAGNVDVITPSPPGTLALSLAWPNPAIGAVSVQLALPGTQRVRAAIMDIAGREVRVVADGVLNAGRHDLAWDGRGESLERARPGVYFMVVEAASGRATRKIVLAQ
jgi:hypothetical protein